MKYTEEYTISVYSYMYPEDKSFKDITKDRITLIASFLTEMEGKVPFMVTSRTRHVLTGYRVSEFEIDKMTPLHA